MSELRSEDIEAKLQFVESLLVKLGGKPLEINAKNREKFNQRVTFLLDDHYYRVERMEFEDSDKLYVVLSCTDNEKYADIGLMDDIEAFSFDLPDEEVEKELKNALGL